MYSRLLTVCLLLLTLLLPGGVSAPQAFCSETKETTAKAVEIAPDATPQQVVDTIAAMNDEQVRLTLLKYMEQTHEKPVEVTEEQRFKNSIDNVRKVADIIKTRIMHLAVGAADTTVNLPDALKHAFQGRGTIPPGRLLLGLLLLTALWALSRYLYRRKTALIRSTIHATPASASLLVKVGRLFLRAAIDGFGILVTALGAFALYFIFFDESTAAKPLIIIWLYTIVFVEFAALLSRFILVPRASALRYLPLDDKTAMYMHSWVVRFALVISIGLLFSALVVFQKGSEAQHLFVLAIIGLVISIISSFLVLKHKHDIAAIIVKNAQPGALRLQLAKSWHLGAVALIFLLWLCWVFGLILEGGRMLRPGAITILSVPVFLLLNHAAQRLVDYATSLAMPEGMELPGAAPEPAETEAPAEAPSPLATDETSKDEQASETVSGETSEETSEAEEHMPLPPIVRFNALLKNGFSFFILLAVVVWVCRAWGFYLPIGREVARSAFSILATLVLAYIAWVFISNAIEKRIGGGGDEHDHGGEGGGAGGDRLATLLHLLKKFIFVALAVVVALIVLSSMGVQIAPLLAGAGVFGIAIGFGAQSLVKDVISGVFFLMDDAFRVGDYIEIGNNLGTVEEITVRSIKLRHPRGPVFIIPYGSMHMVKNNSRDWSIMKIKYTVPFDSNEKQIKKIIKKINKEVMAVDEYKDLLLDNIKSQGMYAIDQYGIIMRVKFKTVPGGQYTIRKILLPMMHKAFEEAGIEFARPVVSVQVDGGDASNLSKEQLDKVGAAAQNVHTEREKQKMQQETQKK